MVLVIGGIVSKQNMGQTKYLLWFDRNWEKRNGRNKHIHYFV